MWKSVVCNNVVSYVKQQQMLSCCSLNVNRVSQDKVNNVISKWYFGVIS